VAAKKDIPIADLHCHYSMHVIGDDLHPRGTHEGLLGRLLTLVDAGLLRILNHAFNSAEWTSGWRVDLKGLIDANAQLVWSVLYWPAAEFEIGSLLESGPKTEFYEDITSLLTAVEDDVAKQAAEIQANTGDPVAYTFVKKRDDLKGDGIKFVHCVEGGFQLGDGTRAEIEQRVKELADQGVVYITLAHLFYRQVATNSNAFPFLSATQYSDLFPMPKRGLTKLGRIMIEAMYENGIFVDISHMNNLAIRETLDLVDQLDEREGRKKEPGRYPILATHQGMRSVVPGQEYNLSDAVAAKIRAREGLVGMIMATHQMGETLSAQASRDVLKKHMDAVRAACGDDSCTAIGSDLDGFIKPTLDGIKNYGDMRNVKEWVEKDQPKAARKILYDNARRVTERRFP
jgi:microsomal dipeptidase-like Zn-dependent dipeptidase